MIADTSDELWELNVLVCLLAKKLKQEHEDEFHSIAGCFKERYHDSCDTCDLLNRADVRMAISWATKNDPRCREIEAAPQ